MTQQLPASEPRTASGGEAEEPSRGLAGALRPAWVGVDLDALLRNLATCRRLLGPTRILAVVKADAYGHGARQVGRALAEAGVDQLGVALVEEGAELRRAGIEAPILVLGTCHESQLPLFRRYRLTPTVSSPEQLALWSEWARGESRPFPVHLKVDTGMARLGFAPEDLAAALDQVRRHPILELEGLASHLADADLDGGGRTPEQAGRFDELLELLTTDERRRLIIHLANSAGALHSPSCRHGMVRLGLVLLGLDPRRRVTDLEPVMSVSARVTALREVPAGSAVSYGGRWTATARSRIAVLPIGYADGYPWRLSNRGGVLLDGRRAPITGSVTMDMTLVDVGDARVRVGSEAILLGSQGEAIIDAWRLAEEAGTLPYEILCGLGLRLPRRYRRDGVWSEMSSRFAGGGR